ncbi:MAG: tRNA lysidine(34) synthetase TilS [Lachnospiraceae bacterium]|nr:tRNA lysidine(34) synthetase TilS [Lachnospiraceae bacterium]
MKAGAEVIFKKYMDGIPVSDAGMHLVVGVSGGADSICLLFLLLGYFDKSDIRVIHINHMIRGEEADEDSLFVEKICEEHGVFFKEIKKDIPAYASENGLSEEEAGRRFRYECFEKEALEWEKECSFPEGSVRIAVAHHLEDNAETVLFNLFRGSGIKGLSGIGSERGRIIRPLIDMSRKDIEAYLEEKKITFRTDRTNADNSYARNRIRNVIIPEACEICSAAPEHISEASKKLRRISEYLGIQVDEARKAAVSSDAPGTFRVDRKAFESLPEIIGSMLILELLTELTPFKKDIGEVHAEAVISLLGAGAGKHADLPYGIKADVSAGELLLRTSDAAGRSREAEDLFVSAVYFKASDLEPDERKALTDPAFAGNGYTKYFDCDKITSIASLEGVSDPPYYEIRKRREGDHMMITAGGKAATRKIGDYLTDLKLSPDEKENILVCAVGSEVLWVIGRRMADSAKLDDGTVNILKLEVKE